MSVKNGDNVVIKTKAQLMEIFTDAKMFGSCDMRTHKATLLDGATGSASGVGNTNFTFTKDVEEEETATAQILPVSAIASYETPEG